MEDGQNQMAIIDLTKALEVDSAFPSHTNDIYVNRGFAYSRLGNKEESISDWQSACALGDNRGCRLGGTDKRVVKFKDMEADQPTSPVDDPFGKKDVIYHVGEWNIVFSDKYSADVYIWRNNGALAVELPRYSAGYWLLGLRGSVQTISDDGRNEPRPSGCLGSPPFDRIPANHYPVRSILSTNYDGFLIEASPTEIRVRTKFVGFVNGRNIHGQIVIEAHAKEIHFRSTSGQVFTYH